jgi:hypothetical protein
MASEQRTFVFAVSFIIIISALISTIPVGLQGQGATGDDVTPINPNLLTDFAETSDYDKTDFSGTPTLKYVYDLPLVDGTTFECLFASNQFYIGAHTLFVGLWLGGYSWANFIAENGTNYGGSVSFTDIDNDLVEGAVRYTLQYEDTGNSAGGFVLYYNTTTYTDSSDAWDSSELFIVHGVGMSADTNIASLLLSLMFLQLPDVPFLVNVILITPMWAGIIYVAWFIIKSMIPLLG